MRAYDGNKMCLHYPEEIGEAWQFNYIDNGEWSPLETISDRCAKFLLECEIELHELKILEAKNVLRKIRGYEEAQDE